MNMKFLFSGFFVFWGTLCFMMVVGHEVRRQRQQLEYQKRLKEELARRQATLIPVAKLATLPNPQRITPAPAQNR